MDLNFSLHECKKRITEKQSYAELEHFVWLGRLCDTQITAYK